MQQLYFHEVLDPVRQPGAHTRYLARLGEDVRSRGNAEGSASNGCVAAWVPLFLTGRWPEIITFWEMQDGWDGFARHFDANDDLFHRPLEKFYAERSGGFDRVLVAADYSVDREQVLSHGVRAAVVLQQIVTLAPGGAEPYLERLGLSVSAFGEAGIRLFGAYETAFRNGSEVVVLWAFDNFRSLCKLHADPACVPAWQQWQHQSRSMELSHEALILRPASWSPLR